MKNVVTAEKIPQTNLPKLWKLLWGLQIPLPKVCRNIKLTFVEGKSIIILRHFMWDKFERLIASQFRVEIIHNSNSSQEQLQKMSQLSVLRQKSNHPKLSSNSQNEAGLEMDSL